MKARLTQVSFTAAICCLGCAVLVAPLPSCSKKKTMETLYKESTSPDLVFYKNKDTLYPPKSDSPHGEFKLKFNSVAAASLDNTGKLPAGKEFEKGALIVKEVHKNGSVDLYAVMKKDPSSKFAANKWVWAEFKKDGSTFHSVSKRGEGCTGCHSGSTNRDLTRSFDLH
jgi:hypothetical protein